MLDRLTHRLFAAGPPAPVCLMYHSIPVGKATAKWDVPLDNFKQQMRLLQTYGWKTRLIAQIAEQTLPKTAFITFDDGYQDNYAAFEALVDNTFVATWFMVSGSIGRPSDWDSNITDPKPMLDAEQIKRFVSAGMEIGSHSLTHAKLNELTSEQYHAELKDSKSMLEELIDREVSAFAYPYGLYNSAIKDAVAQAGYQRACTTQSGFGLIDHDPLQIRRITIYSHDSLATFARKLVFGDNVAGWGKTTNYLCRRLFHKLS